MFSNIILSWPNFSADWVAPLFKLSGLSSYMKSSILAKILSNLILCSKSPRGLDVEGSFIHFFLLLQNALILPHGLTQGYPSFLSAIVVHFPH